MYKNGAGAGEGEGEGVSNTVVQETKTSNNPGHQSTSLGPQNLPSPRIRPIHQRDLARNLGPLELALDADQAGLAAVVVAGAGALLRLQQLLPLEQLVGEAQVRLDDDVEPPRPHEAVRPRERHVELAHHLGDADGGAARDADAAVDEGGGAVAAAAVWVPVLVCVWMRIGGGGGGKEKGEDEKNKKKRRGKGGKRKEGKYQ